MPRFYFHLQDDVDAPDEEGVEVEDVGAARQHAERHLLFTASETLRHERKVVLHHRIDIEDGEGNVLDTVHVGDLVKVEE